MCLCFFVFGFLSIQWLTKSMNLLKVWVGLMKCINCPHSNMFFISFGYKKYASKIW
jgi:hypothetical protein